MSLSVPGVEEGELKLNKQDCGGNVLGISGTLYERCGAWGITEEEADVAHSQEGGSDAVASVPDAEDGMAVALDVPTNATACERCIAKTVGTRWWTAGCLRRARPAPTPGTCPRASWRSLQPTWHPGVHSPHIWSLSITYPREPAISGLEAPPAPPTPIHHVDSPASCSGNLRTHSLANIIIHSQIPLLKCAATQRSLTARLDLYSDPAAGHPSGGMRWISSESLHVLC